MPARFIAAGADATALANLIQNLSPDVAGIAFKRDDNTIGILDPDTGTISYFPIGVTATAAQINAIAGASGALNPGDRQIKCAVFPLVGATIHAAVTAAIQFAAASIIHRVIADITTVATGACTLDIGYTPTSATTGSDSLLDGIDVNAGVAMFDSMDPALDTGANAHAQKAASGKWITVQEKTGDATGLVGNLYIFYSLI